MSIIGFANGVFDGFHAGHLHLLTVAKSHCDELVVGLNSDSSARRLKGEGRPINNAGERRLKILGSGLVARCFIFNEGDLLHVIEDVNPRYIFKGGDYNPHDVVGGHIARANGGDVIIVSTLPGFSTTALLHGTNPETCKP